MKKKIFVVEDSPMDIANISRLLEKLGHDYVIIEDGFTAANTIKRTDEHINLVILDLNLPEIDGISILGDIRTNKPNLPVIVLSSTEDAEEISQINDLGATHFLQKPAKLETLDAAINSALNIS